jgi:hypothetical protein
LVEKEWEKVISSAHDEGVLAKLSTLHSALHAWDREVLNQPKRRLRKAQRDLENALSGPMSDENDAIAKEMANLVELLLEQEEVHSMQRSRANWLQFGDRNSSFFHNFASARRKKNYIKKLKDENNNFVEGTELLKPIILNYFSNLFTSEVHETDPAVLEKIMPRISQDINDKLLAPFSPEEVKKAAFSIGDFKAPGPDGLHAVFL